MEFTELSVYLKSKKQTLGFRKILFGVFLGLFVALSASQLTSCKLILNQEAQENRRIKATQRQISKEKEERYAAYRKQADRQHKSQDKATRKRMKELERKSKRWRDNKPVPFYERWYYQWTKERKTRRQERIE